MLLVTGCWWVLLLWVEVVVCVVVVAVAVVVATAMYVSARTTECTGEVFPWQ